MDDDGLPTAANPIRIGCTLPDEQIPDQLDEWRVLIRSATAVEPIDGGRRLTFPGDLGVAVRDLAAREQSCCSFLRLVVDEHDDGVVLAITAGDPDDPAGRSVIDMIVSGAVADSVPETGKIAETDDST